MNVSAGAPWARHLRVTVLPGSPATRDKFSDSFISGGTESMSNINIYFESARITTLLNKDTYYLKQILQWLKNHYNEHGVFIKLLLIYLDLAYKHQITKSFLSLSGSQNTKKSAISHHILMQLTWNIYNFSLEKTQPFIMLSSLLHSLNSGHLSVHSSQQVVTR